MESEREIAEAFIARVVSRGHSVVVAPSGRPRLLPEKEAYKELTIEEQAVWRDHKRAIATVVALGLMPTTAPPRAEPATPAPTPAPAPPPPEKCPHCHQSPCVGPSHQDFAILHRNDPAEVERRRQYRFKEMLRMLPYGHWSRIP